MDIHKRFIAKKAYSRLDHFLSEMLSNMSRSQATKLLKENLVKLNGKTVTRKNLEIEVGDAVEVALPQEEEQDYTPTIELNRLFEDEHILIIDKPIGIAVHPGSGGKEETILDVFKYRCPQVREMEELEPERPGIVHRLDKDTSGVMVLAKDIRSMRRLQKQFKRRGVHKTYVALVSGMVRHRNGTIDAAIARDNKNRTRFRVIETNDFQRFSEAREAVTDFSVNYQFEDFALVSLAPQTGRTHQIRVHLAHYGNPVLGDIWYGKKRGKDFERLALHAYSIEFEHPITGHGIQAFSPMPLLFREFIKNRFQKD